METAPASRASSALVKRVTLRESRFEDRDSVLALMRRNGLVVQPSAGNWQWLWRDNPAAAHMHTAWPIGWVLEDKGGIVGYLGNVPLRSLFKGKIVRVAAARGFAVDPHARGHSLRLAATFFSQTGADLLLNTSANAGAAAVWGLCKGFVIPQSGYNETLLWILKDRAFLMSVIRKLGQPAWLANLASAILAPAVAAERFVFRRATSRSSGAIISVFDPDQIDKRFDELWESTLRAFPTRLMADRSACSLRWHFGHVNAPERESKVLALSKGGELAGYAVLTREDSARLGLRRMRISDLLARNDDIAVIDHLLVASHDFAFSAGSHTLELVGFPKLVRDRALARKPYAYRVAVTPYWYKARDSQLAQQLVAEDSWYGTPFDGDTSL